MNGHNIDECKHKDWKNVKQISAKGIAYCIFKHNFDIEQVPQKRLSTVKKELSKLQREHEKTQTKESIEELLVSHVSVLIPPTTGLFKDIEVYEDTDEALVDKDGAIQYLLDPTLFNTLEEVELAKSELDRILHKEFTYTEIHNGVYRDSNRRADDIRGIQKAMKKIANQYKALGGSTKLFYDAVKHIPIPEPLTLNQTIKNEREYTVNQFLKLGTSKTRATKIANHITDTILCCLPI